MDGLRLDKINDSLSAVFDSVFAYIYIFVLHEREWHAFVI
jgi:hypothetical protein